MALRFLPQTYASLEFPPPNLFVNLWFHPKTYACIQEIPPNIRLNTENTPEATREYM